MTGCSCAGMRTSTTTVTPPPPPEPPEVGPTPTPTPSPTLAQALPDAPTVPPDSGTPIGALALVQPAAGDVDLLNSITAHMRESKTATSVLTQLAGGNARVQFLSASEFTAQYPNSFAAFEDSTNTIMLPRDVAKTNAVGVAVALAHEGTHWIQDPLVEADKALVNQQVASQSNQQAFLGRKIVEIQLAGETEAHMVDARVGLELGMEVKPGHQHVAVNPDGSLRTFEQTWLALKQGTTYNPAGLEEVPMRWYNRVITDPAARPGGG